METELEELFQFLNTNLVQRQRVGQKPRVSSPVAEQTTINQESVLWLLLVELRPLPVSLDPWIFPNTGDRLTRLLLDAADLVPCEDRDSNSLTQLFLSEDLAPYWLKNIITESSYTQGKITCPKCQGRLGSFDFLKTKRRCPCGRTLVPSVHFTRDRVDVIDTNYKIKITTPQTNRLSPKGMTSGNDGNIDGLSPLNNNTDCDVTNVLSPLNGNGSLSSSAVACDTTQASMNAVQTSDREENVAQSTGCEARLLAVLGSDNPITGDAKCFETSTVSEDENLEQRVTGFGAASETTPMVEEAMSHSAATLVDGFYTRDSKTLEELRKERMTGHKTPEQRATGFVVTSGMIAEGEADFQSTAAVRSDRFAVSQNSCGMRKRDKRRMKKLESDEIADAVEDYNAFRVLQSLDGEVETGVLDILLSPTGGSASWQERSGKEEREALLLEKTLKETIQQQREREALALQSDDVPLEYTCAMCLDVMLNPHTTLPCSHDFCGMCLRRLALSSPINTKCPLCRETITKCIPNSELSRVLHEEYPLQLKLRKQQEKKIYPRNSPLPGSAGPASFFSRLRHRHPRLLPGRFGPSRRKLFFMLLNIVVVLGLSYFGMVLCRHVLGFVAEALDAIMEKLTGEKLWSEFMGVESRILTVSTVFVLYLVSACMVRFLRLFQQIENA
ncbi:hypothetical protein BaRGS_00035273 [Batillaria attramentaria]|uniref:RING-type domain-containing protein n=1 Tax=Batillaria attramentaria TaxID=370345 RepID=A0ABD0JF02_9CAEN